ncbi:hypothetical protein CVS47_01682 [Microbacterium lemovicicum]|uniref:DUF559 domain-containing protein n=1 Tax=Microbacterium lemovicicum TaxID=1072463 RepID=A0A3Q9J3J5_9MICO|nr:hypothetical protein CVS47_01682 [Microbacterium lemovicicum]
MWEARHLGVASQRLRRRDVVAPFFGVRAPKDGVVDLIDLCRAYAVVERRDFLFSHVTAARLWGVPLPRFLEVDARLHVLLPGGSNRPRADGVVGHTTLMTVTAARLHGLQLTGPATTWSALSSTLSLDALVVAGDRLLHWRQPLCSVDDLHEAVWALSGRRGARTARAALEEIRPRSRSPRETRCRLALTRAGLPEPELNASIEMVGGTVIFGDLVYRRDRVLIEYEGTQHRTDDDQWSRDLRRYNALSLAGWRVVRVTNAMSDGEIVALVRRAFQPR